MENPLSKYSTEELEDELRRRKHKSKQKENVHRVKNYGETMSEKDLDDMEKMEYSRLEKLGR